MLVFSFSGVDINMFEARGGKFLSHRGGISQIPLKPQSQEVSAVQKLSNHINCARIA
jgi:hypothetical protein